MYAVVGVEAIQLQRLYKKNVQLLKFKVSLAIGAEDTGESDMVTLCVCRLGFQQIALPTVSNEKALQMHSIDINSSQFRDPIKKCDWSAEVVRGGPSGASYLHEVLLRQRRGMGFVVPIAFAIWTWRKRQNSRL